MADRRSIQRFEVLGELGSGGMGTVYRARDPQLERDVAIKVLNRAPGGSFPDLSTARTLDLRATPNDGKLLFHEARVMARLSHPNIVPIYEVGLDESGVFVVMEHVAGVSLREWLKTPRRTEEIVTMFAQAGHGLRAAHDQGIVHRDFKPDNVMVGADERVRVMDFGLAQLCDRDPDTSPSGGTPRYMAPEVWEGGPATPKADVFSFAVALVDALGGDPRGDRATLERHLRNRLRRPVVAHVLAALADEPAARPSIDALTEALESGRGRAAWIGGGLAIAASVGVLAAVATRGQSAPWRPAVVDLPAFEENLMGVAVSHDGERVAYASDREHRLRHRIYVEPLRGGQPQAITPTTDDAIRPRWTRDGRAVLFVVKRADGLTIARSDVAGGAIVEIAKGSWVDDCGSALAIVHGTAETDKLSLLGRDGSRRDLVTAPVGEAIWTPQCDRAGERIVFARGQVLKTITADVYTVDREGRVTRITEDRTSAYPAFANGDASIVFGTEREGKTQLYEVPVGGGAIRQVTFEGGIDRGPSETPEGLLFVRKVGSMILHAGSREAGSRKVSARQDMLVRVAPARDGRRVVAERIYNQLSSDLVVIDMRDDSVRTLGPGQRPCLSADERVVYFRAVDDPRRLQSIGIDGGTPTTIATFPHAILAIAHAPDGLHVSLLDGDRRHAWRVATGAAPVSEGLDGFVQPAPDGRWRAVGTVRDEDTRTLRLVPPGGDLATAGRTLVMTTPRVTWIDDTRLGYGHDGAFRVIDVTTGVELSAMPVGGLPLTYSALAGDGEHWFIIEEVARATRHLITNFADRPGADRRSRSPSVIELIVGDDGLGDSRQPANPVGRELVVRHVEPREPQRPARHPARIVVGDRAATDRVWQYARAGCPPRACHRRTCPG